MSLTVNPFASHHPAEKRSGGIACPVWVEDDGTPADFKFEGWLETPVNGVSTRLTIAQEFLVTATSGVTITAPI